MSLELWSSTLPPPQINAPARAQPEPELLFLHLHVGLSFSETLTGKSDSKTPTDVNLAQESSSDVPPYPSFFVPCVFV